MADPYHLHGFALAAYRRAEHRTRIRVADRAQAAPEGRRDTPVIRLLHDSLELTVFDYLSPFAAELELVAMIVDRPGGIRAHEDAVFDARDHFVERTCSRFNVEVGHAIDRCAVPARRARVSHAFHVGALLGQTAAKRSFEHAGANEVVLVRLFAVVIESVGR